MEYAKRFYPSAREHIITWLLRCWDNGADGHELEGSEAKQLGSLAREGGIDKAIAREKRSLSLWKRLLAAMKDRFPKKDDVMSRAAKWTTLEKGIQSLRESAIVEMIYNIKPNNGDIPIDPGEVECTRPMWRKFTRNAPPSYAHSLATVTWNDIIPPTVDEVIHKLREFEDNLTPSIISAVEKLSQDLKQVRDDLSSSSCVPTHVSAINKKHPTV
ncbi:Friend virus susceptibility protein 1-like [Ara ararauna]